jgi:RHS repeat-associated protein
LQTRYASGAGAVAVTGYSYGDALHKHAVTTANFGGTPQSYGYDANGNATSARGLPVSWTSFNMPYEIGSTSGGAWSRFGYGPDRARWKQVIQSPGFGQGTTYYVGALYEREMRGAGQIDRYHIFANGKAVAYKTWKSGGTTELNYLHRDHLGSVVGISSAGGFGREFYGYDAWGKRRSQYTWSSLSAGSFTVSTLLSNSDGYRRGYTGHEMLDHVGLIHMNGRIYDPEIGRFLSADPNVQFPESTQGYDRYQYVNNNPLSASDPSGYFLMAVVAIAGAAAPASQAVNVAIAIATAGFVDSGGNLKVAAIAFASAGVSNWIGGQFVAGANGSLSTTQIVQKALLHGLAQGALSVASGGRFGDGALGAFAGGVLDLPAFDFLPQGGIAGLVTTAVVGGTIVEIGGGKFANGAISAAFVSAFGNAGGSEKSRDGLRPTPAKLTSEQRAQLDEALTTVNAELAARKHTFNSEADAAKWLDAKVGALSRQYDVEIGANIYKGSIPGKSVVFGVETQYKTNTVSISGHAGWSISADFHTHGSSAYSSLFSRFSDGDLDGLPHGSYLSANNGNLYHYDHGAFSASKMADSVANRRLFVRAVP